MRRKLLLIPLLIALLMPLKANATEYDTPKLMRCTCYTSDEGAVTASGQTVREGIVAGMVENRDSVAIIYENNDGKIGDIIGYFEILDTGGELIQSGDRIDVYRNTLERCEKWIAEYGDYVYVQIIPAVG